MTNPFMENEELYWIKRETFVQYIEDEVNPARKNAGLQEIDLKSATEAYRILGDFFLKWGK